MKKDGVQMALHHLKTGLEIEWKTICTRHLIIWPFEYWNWKHLVIKSFWYLNVRQISTVNALHFYRTHFVYRRFDMSFIHSFMHSFIYSERPKTGPSDFRMAIFQTLFWSDFWMVSKWPTIQKPDKNCLVFWWSC